MMRDEGDGWRERWAWMRERRKDGMKTQYIRIREMLEASIRAQSGERKISTSYFCHGFILLFLFSWYSHDFHEVLQTIVA